MAFENVKESIEGAVAAEDLTASQFLVVTDAGDVNSNILSGNAETYALVDGQTLLVAVNGGAPQTATFNTGDFGDINNATAAEVAAVIQADVSDVTSSDSGGSVLIQVDGVFEEGTSIQVVGGTANAALGFDTARVDVEGRGVRTTGLTLGGDHLGVLQNNPNTGEAAMVAVSGRTKMVAGAQILKGQNVASDTAGKAVVAASGNFTVGRAVTPAAAADDLFTVDLDKLQLN